MRRSDRFDGLHLIPVHVCDDAVRLLLRPLLCFDDRNLGEPTQSKKQQQPQQRQRYHKHTAIQIARSLLWQHGIEPAASTSIGGQQPAVATSSSNIKTFTDANSTPASSCCVSAQIRTRAAHKRTHTHSSVDRVGGLRSP